MSLRRKAKVGEVLFVDVVPDNREWGYNPAPDGTPVRVLKTGDHWPLVLLPDSTTQQISEWHLCESKVNPARLRSACEAMSRFLVWVEMEAFARSWADESGWAIDRCRRDVFCDSLCEEDRFTLSWPALRGDRR